MRDEIILAFEDGVRIGLDKALQEIKAVVELAT